MKLTTGSYMMIGAYCLMAAAADPILSKPMVLAAIAGCVFSCWWWQR